MPLSPIPASSQSDGRWKITFLPSTATNPLSLAILNGGTAKDLTYSFTPDGFNFSGSQETIADPRLTLIQNLSRPGKSTETGSVKYVDSTDAASAAVILAPTTGSQNGPAGYFVVRKGVDNAVAWTVGDKVDVYTFQAGMPLPDAPTENSVDTITQGIFLTQPTTRKQSVVA